MQTERRVDKTQSVNRQPSLAVGAERRRMERKLESAGVFCQPKRFPFYIKRSLSDRCSAEWNRVAQTETSAVTLRSATSTVNQFRGSNQSTALQRTDGTRL